MTFKTITFFSLFLWAAPCFGLDVTFLTQAEITDKTVTLGDIVTFSDHSDLADALSSQVIAQSPQPGEAMVIDSRQVISRLIKENGPINSVFWKGSSAVSVKRASIHISSTDILQQIDLYLEENRNRLPQAKITFKPSVLPLPFQLPTGHVSYEIIPSSPGIIGSSRFSIICRVNGKVEKNFSVRGHVEAITPVVVATKRLRYGDIISPDMIRLVPRDIAEIDNYITALEVVAGSYVKRSVAKGTAIDTEAIEQPPMIRRGEFVKIVINHNGLLLTATGIAKNNGRKNDMIRVKNSNSSKLIFCRIQAPGNRGGQDLIMNKHYIYSFLFLFLATSCAQKNNNVVEIPEPLEEIQTQKQVQRSDGSLWNDANGSLISDHKARNIGDIVTIVISEESSATRSATTSSGRDSSFTAAIPNLLGLEQSEVILDTNLDLSNLVNATFSNSFEGNGTTARSGQS